MANDLKGITERIIVKADKELERRIDAAVEPLDHLLRNGIGYRIKVTDENKKEPDVEVLWYRALSALKEKAFELHRDKNRQVELDAFMAKVDSLSRQVEELQSVAHAPGE